MACLHNKQSLYNIFDIFSSKKNRQLPVVISSSYLPFIIEDFIYFLREVFAVWRKFTYSLKIKQPIAVVVQPGNIPDVLSIEYCLKQLNWLHADSYKVVTDNGFYSLDNIIRYVKKNIKFLTRIRKDISWVKAEINAHREEWFSPNAIDRKQSGLHGITLMINKEVSWVRQRTRNGIDKGKTEKKSVRLYLHIFLDRNKVADEQDTLIKRLNYIREQLESGITEFDKEAQNLFDTYITVKKRGSKITTKIREEAWKEAQKNFGIFALLSNKKTEPFEALNEYRLREKIEEAYRLQKGQADGKKTRVWHDDNYMGRVFCQMVALGYQLYFREAVLRVKKLLAVRQDSDTESTWKAKEELKKWLNQMSDVEILDWFDSIEETRARRDRDRLALKTELTARDKLFLDLLMSPTEDTQPSVANKTAGTDKQNGATPNTDATDAQPSVANETAGTDKQNGATPNTDATDAQPSVANETAGTGKQNGATPNTDATDAQPSVANETAGTGKQNGATSVSDTRDTQGSVTEVNDIE